MREGAEHYASFLLRVWRVCELRDAWRVSLENAETHELRGFASLEEVFEFLSREVEHRCEPGYQVRTKTVDPNPEED